MKLYVDSTHIGIKYNDTDLYEHTIFLGEMVSVLPDGHNFFINFENHPPTRYIAKIEYDRLTDYNDTGGVPSYNSILNDILAFRSGQQESYKDEGTIVTAFPCTVTTDLMIPHIIDRNSVWRLLVSWTANDGTTTTVQPITSNDGVTKYTYGDPSLPVSYTIGAPAAGNISFEDSYLSDNYLGLRVTPQSGKTITVTVYYILKG